MLLTFAKAMQSVQGQAFQILDSCPNPHAVFQPH